MEQDFYRDRLAGHSLRVLVPNAADRAEVHRIIAEVHRITYEELCLEVIREESRQTYRQVIDRLAAGAGAGAEGSSPAAVAREALQRG